MTVRDLIDILETYDEDMKVAIAVKQAPQMYEVKDIGFNIKKRKIESYFGEDYEAVVIYEGLKSGYM